MTFFTEIEETILTLRGKHEPKAAVSVSTNGAGITSLSFKLYYRAITTEAARYRPKIDTQLTGYNTERRNTPLEGQISNR